MPLTKTLYKEAQFANAGLQIIAGNFTFNGSGEPDGAEGEPFNPDGTDLDRTGTGDYTLTIPGRGGLDILACFLQIEDGTDLLSIQDITRDDTARTIAFTVYDAETVATPTDPTDGAKLHVLIFLKSRQV